MQPFAFDNRHVYVVGGSLGIGLAAAQQMAARGAHITVFARRQQPLADAVETIRQRCQTRQQRIVAQQLDAGDAAQVAAVMATCVAQHGGPDVLLNCAGRAIPDYFERIGYEQFAETLRANLHTCWNTVSALLPHLKARGGYIVNTASLAGLMGVFGYTDYCAAKFAVVGFSEALRSELKPHNVVVSVLCPPDTDTPGFADENTTKPAETRAVSSSARVLSADAVAAALLAGMAKRSFLIIPGAEGRVAALAKRLAPGLVTRIMDRAVRTAQRRR